MATSYRVCRTTDPVTLIGQDKSSGPARPSLAVSAGRAGVEGDTDAVVFPADTGLPVVDVLLSGGVVAVGAAAITRGGVRGFVDRQAHRAALDRGQPHRCCGGLNEAAVRLLQLELHG